MAPEPRLIILVLSPYNELARWSLDRAGVAYQEDQQALVQHVLTSRRAGGKGTPGLTSAETARYGSEFPRRWRLLTTD
jgi:glutathione S-transferase